MNTEELNAFFANRTAGDVLSLTSEDGVVSELVYLRETGTGGMLFAEVNKSGKKIDNFVPGILSWSQELGALLIDGKVPEWWNSEIATYIPVKHVELAKFYIDTPVPEDTVKLSEAEFTKITNAMGNVFIVSSLRFLNGFNDMHAIRLLLKEIGLPMTDVQFDQFRTVLMHVRTVRGLEANFDKIMAASYFDGIFDFPGDPSKGKLH